MNKNLNKKIKPILKIYKTDRKHWVGEAFYVKNIFSYNDANNQDLSPFVLLDYAEPHYFSPSSHQRGVGEHPHRGFETVSIIYQGEVKHYDNKGNEGIISEGDIQWMTAGKGIIHSEFHSNNFAKTGGIFEAIQLWVNLPKKYKMTLPKYQDIKKEKIPVVKLDNNGTTLRVLSGKYAEHQSPVNTFTAINAWDIDLKANNEIDFELQENYTTLIFITKGSIVIDNQIIKAGEAVLFKRMGNNIIIKSLEEARILLLSAEPLDEPIFGYGPFVVNSKEEIEQSIIDFNNGFN